MKEREEFEGWTRKFYSDLACASDTWSDEKGTYTDYAHHMAWHLWQELQSRLEEVNQKVEELEKESASLKRDAERYCEYKENSNIRFSLFSGRYRADNGHAILTDWLESFDECFDTAMQDNKETNA